MPALRIPSHVYSPSHLGQDGKGHAVSLLHEGGDLLPRAGLTAELVAREREDGELILRKERRGGGGGGGNRTKNGIENQSRRGADLTRAGRRSNRSRLPRGQTKEHYGVKIATFGRWSAENRLPQRRKGTEDTKSSQEGWNEEARNLVRDRREGDHEISAKVTTSAGHRWRDASRDRDSP